MREWNGGCDGAEQKKEELAECPVAAVCLALGLADRGAELAAGAHVLGPDPASDGGPGVRPGHNVAQRLPAAVRHTHLQLGAKTARPVVGFLSVFPSADCGHGGFALGAKSA